MWNIHSGVSLGSLVATRREQSAAAVGDELGLHEHLGERRVREVGRRVGEHHLGVARQLDLPRAAPGIGQVHAAHFGVVLGRDQDFR